MYLVTQKFMKPSRGVPKYKCQVFYISANNPGNISDVTDQVAKKFDLILKDNYIVVIHGSGTGVARITEALKSKDKNIIVHDVSFRIY